MRQEIRKRLPPERLSQIGIGVLLLIIIRTLAEVFRLQYVDGDALTIAQASPYVGAALFTAVILAAALIGYLWGYYRTVIGGAIATVAVLLVYKIAVIG